MVGNAANTDNNVSEADEMADSANETSESFRAGMFCDVLCKSTARSLEKPVNYACSTHE